MKNRNTEYNGHKNWHYWNVSLWLFNDEGLYRLMLNVCKWHKNKREAARVLCHILQGHYHGFSGGRGARTVTYSKDGEVDVVVHKPRIKSGYTLGDKKSTNETTPDGGMYTIGAVLEAIRDIES